jgi:hypothetical protein
MDGQGWDKTARPPAWFQEQNEDRDVGSVAFPDGSIEKRNRIGHAPS